MENQIVKPLETVGGEELLEMQLPPKGLAMLVGSTKVGKAFLSLQVALAVSGGENLWSFPTHKGHVLYAIPKDQWQQMLSLLNEQSGFHETLLTVMDRLPTSKAIDRFMNTTLERQLTMFSSQTDEVKASVKLAGSGQEKFISEDQEHSSGRGQVQAS